MGATFRHVSIQALGVVLLCGGSAFAQELHKDERLGFQLKVPRGWKAIPVRSDDRWIVGKYRAPKPERSTDPTSGDTLEDFPELLLVALVDPEVREKAEQQAPRPGRTAKTARTARTGKRARTPRSPTAPTPST